MRKILLLLALFSATILSAKVKSEFPVDLTKMDHPYYLLSGSDWYPQTIYGDLKLDSIVWKYTPMLGSDGWGYYLFDANGNLTKQDYYYEGSNHYQVFYDYDANGHCWQSVAKGINTYNAQWEEVQKAEFICDAKGRATQQIHSLYASGKWQPLVKYTATFDAHDNCTEWAEYQYQTDLQTWKTTYMFKSTYTYNANGQVTKRESTYWYPDNGWKNGAKYEYEYDAKGRETLCIEYNGSGSSWINYKKRTTGYSDPIDGVIYVLIHTEEWNSSTSQWNNYEVEGYRYYENGPWYYYTESFYENSSLQSYLTQNRTFNANGQLILDETEYASDHHIDRSEYSYDEFGNRITYIYSESGKTVSTRRWYFSAPTEGIDEVFTNKADNQARKVLRNGQIHILRNNRVYTLDGKELR